MAGRSCKPVPKGNLGLLWGLPKCWCTLIPKSVLGLIQKTFLNLGLTNTDQMTKHCKVPQTETDKTRKQRFTTVIDCNHKLVPTSGKEKVVKNVKQQYSSALQLSGKSVTTDYWAPWFLSTHIHTSAAETIEAKRTRGYIWKQKFSKPQNIRVHSSHEALFQEHWEHHQLREAGVIESEPAYWVGHLASVLIYITERCSWKNILQHTWKQSGASKPSVLAKASCWSACPAPPGLLAPHHGSIFPWKLRADPESYNPAGDVHGQRTNTLLPYVPC